jgi:hypothetical protein
MLPMIAYYKTLTDQYNLIDPLKELVMDGSANDVLTAEHRQVLENADSIREQYKQTPVHLNRLCSKFNKKTKQPISLSPFRYGRRFIY